MLKPPGNDENTSPPRKMSRLQQLPGELRNHIYDILFEQREVKTGCTYDNDSGPRVSFQDDISGLVLTCRQFYHEW
jgi:hypothetical protein